MRGTARVTKEMRMTGLKPGDTYTATRDGKVFFTQYHNLGAFVSVTRVLGDDPEAERAELDATVERMWHEALLANHNAVNGAYDGMGDGGIDKLIEYLEKKVGHAPEKAKPQGKPRKLKLK